jgi:hypothetical protein
MGERERRMEKLWEEFWKKYPGSYDIKLFSEWFRRRLWKEEVLHGKS